MPTCPYCGHQLIVSLQAEIKLKKKEDFMEKTGFSPLIDFNDSGTIKNFSDRKTGSKIEKIVLHSTGSEKAGRSSVVNWFSNASAQASAHYLITSDGKICGLVREEKKAWHATTANSTSIGIEVQGECGLKQYKESQMLPLAKLIKDIRSRHGNIPIITHADVDPDRKGDDPFKPQHKDAAIKEIEALIATL